ncbi:MAG TPA: histidine kinase [Acidobacteriaceae bacterium]|nr:histidine kinase [Acidobacteriaceae bacterium]
MGNSFRRDVRNYPLYFLLWTIFGLFYFSQGLTQRLVSHDPNPWWRYLVAWLLGVYIWALLTPAILWLGRLFPIERGNWLRRTALQLCFSAGFSVFELGLEDALYSVLHLFPSTAESFLAVFARSLVRGFHGGVLNYWIVLGLQWGVLYYQRYRARSQEVLAIQLRASELQSQLVSAQLNALKMQLQPHFLFNTLNAITVLVRQQKSKDAEQMLGHLSDLLRGVLEDVDAQEVPLRRELEYLQLYLSIEQVRFADRLRVEISTDPSTQEASVPQLILQPIVENAIRHGIGRSSSAGRIFISTAKIHDMVKIRVEDDGPGLSPGSSCEDQGIGLANTRARLRQLYGNEASLEIENGDDRGAVVTMKFPFRSRAEPGKTYASDHADRR